MPLFYIFQCSFDEGVFSEKPKAAKITAIFTKLEPADLTNYRPIYALARISKILRKLMCNRLYNYLTKTPFYALNSLDFRLVTRMMIQLFNLSTR